MNPKHLMIVGAFGATVLAIATAIYPQAEVTVALFGFGALFGKGYGVWEARTEAGRSALKQEGG